ncbi:MAG TPA: heme ABC exporter ATP-binding protein CcmA [Rhizomicrobium sp.]|jgi:heme exporter protein A|nr:heme ABC exporter ATP-binding protein CcmA [Rhizomicrobium sp.]
MAASICIESAERLAELETENLFLVRGGRPVQQKLGCRAAAGEILAITGRNGAGKTSLLRALAGFLEPQEGEIRFRLASGKVVTGGDERGLFVGWVGHHDGIKPQLTPAEHLNFCLAYAQREGDIAAALSEIGLGPLRDLPSQYLSAGQRRRLAFARLTLAGRPLWLLDEPFSALDAQGKLFVRTLMERHCAEGGIVIAATHEPLGLPGAALELC